jgi:hypothetical protein
MMLERWNARRQRGVQEDEGGEDNTDDEDLDFDNIDSDDDDCDDVEPTTIVRGDTF